MELKVGQTVYIKSLEEIQKIFPDAMPYSLHPEMYKYCGTQQVITHVELAGGLRPHNKYRVVIRGFSWPETALEHKVVINQLGV